MQEGDTMLQIMGIAIRRVKQQRTGPARECAGLEEWAGESSSIPLILPCFPSPLSGESHKSESLCSFWGHYLLGYQSCHTNQGMNMGEQFPALSQTLDKRTTPKLCLLRMRTNKIDLGSDRRKHQWNQILSYTEQSQSQELEF